MKPNFTHDVLNSFFLWFDNYLMTKGEAFSVKNTLFYNYSDSRLGGGKVVYGSPYKQWAYDTGIANAIIPTGVTVDGVFTLTGVSGLSIDFDNGRVVFDSGVSTGLTVSGEYTVKEINSYVTDQPEDNLIIENKYISNSRFTSVETYVAPYNPVTPTIFASIENTHNTAFSFGGEDETNCNLKVVAFCESLYQLDGLLNIFSDSYNEVFSVIPMTKHPIGEFGAIKTGLYPSGYSYQDVNLQYSNQTLFIYHVETSKIRDSVLKELNPTLHIGFIDFHIKTYRYPRL